jgi:hypothetical protein
MRRFWLVVWGATLLVVGLAGGVALTYLTVILPRSAELARIQNSSGFMFKLDLRSLVASANPTLSWSFEEVKNEAPYVSGVGGPRIWSRMCTASATVPAAEQKAQVDLIRGILMGEVTSAPASSGIQSISGSSSQEGGDLTQSDSFTYMVQGRNGSMTMHAWGTGDKLRVFVIVQEQ